ncbi:MAG: TauD/TfdA family dioxygenase [Pseudomonadota bacterium]
MVAVIVPRGTEHAAPALLLKPPSQNLITTRQFQSARHLVQALRRRLTTDPYHVVVRAGNAADLIGLSKELIGLLTANPCAEQKSHPNRSPVPFTKIEVKLDALTKSDHVTRYSRTAQALPPHTDSSYDQKPHQILVFAMQRPAANGGANHVIPVDAVVARLDAATRATLRLPIYPFARHRLPILEDRGVRGIAIRYYRQQLLQNPVALKALPPGAKQALFELEEALDHLKTAQSFKLDAGDLLFINNRRALHGRSSFAPTSGRLLFRFRVRAEQF